MYLSRLLHHLCQLHLKISVRGYAASVLHEIDLCQLLVLPKKNKKKNRHNKISCYNLCFFFLLLVSLSSNAKLRRGWICN